MDISNQLMTETIEEGLNEVFFDEFNMDTPPDYARLEDIFKTEKSKKRAEYDLDMRGTGRFTTKGESEDIYEDLIKEKYKTTYVHSTFADSVPITKEYLEDELYNIIKDMVADLGDSARETQYFNSFSVFRNAFSTSYLGADGKALCADDHPRDFGGTLDNKLTDKFSPAVLDSMIVKLLEQVSHSNKVVSNIPAILLVPSARYTQACQITEAKLVPGSNNNEPNIYSSKYSIMVKQSPYISASQGGSDDAVFLLARKHKVKRFVRVPLETWMTEWKQSAKTVTKYCARFRESVGWSSPLGVVGTDGTTGSY